jgi:hypothetical protein
MPFTRRTFLAQSAAAAALPRAAGPAALATEPPRRSLLAAPWPAAKLAGVLVPRPRWQPFPTAAGRPRWEALSTETREALVETGARQLGAEWRSLPATLFLEFVRNGNRSNYEAVYRVRRNRLRELVLAECAEGKDRFLDEIANGVWIVCEETFWGYPAHLSLQKRGFGLPDVTEPVIDLFAAETGALLAWTEYLLGAQLERVHPLVRERIAVEIERRILTPYRTRDDFWWLGLGPLGQARAMNNWNPWINSNCLSCALVFERDQVTRAQFAHKVLRSLDRFLDSYYDDGGCDEGPGYWDRAGGALFDNLELLHSASGGAIDFYAAPLIREIGSYIYRAHIAGPWFVNFADASARAMPAGDVVFRYGRRVADPRMQEFGAWAVQQSGRARPGGSDLLRALPALFDSGDLRGAPARPPLVRDVWLPGIQVMTARLREGSTEGLYIAAQGGHNAESHNHNDVGNFIVYAGGAPALIDVGPETYTAKTFSPQRYEIWTMQSAYHNLPTVNGVMQAAGRQFAAREVACRADDAAAEFSLDIAGAYPHEAGLVSWRRTLHLDRRANRVEVNDRYHFRSGGGRVALTLMTPREVRVERGRLGLGADVAVWFDAQALAPAVEQIRITDARLRPVWGERLYRVQLTAAELPAEGEFKLRIAQA